MIRMGGLCLWVFELKIRVFLCLSYKSVKVILLVRNWRIGYIKDFRVFCNYIISLSLVIEIMSFFSYILYFNLFCFSFKNKLIIFNLVYLFCKKIFYFIINVNLFRIFSCLLMCFKCIIV